MIGVAARAADVPVAAEFFELFKTPWEHAVPTRTYSVVLAVGVPIDDLRANAFLVYGAEAAALDREREIADGA